MGNSSAAAAKGKSDKGKSAPVKKDKYAASEKKKDQSNMLGQLKGSSDHAKQAVYLVYNNLPRFSSKKAWLLDQWNKSCKWHVN